MHGTCSPPTLIMPGTSIRSLTLIFSSTPIMAQAQIASTPAKHSSQDFFYLKQLATCLWRTPNELMFIW
jgi:hypothetical protein